MSTHTVRDLLDTGSHVCMLLELDRAVSVLFRGRLNERLLTSTNSSAPSFEQRDFFDSPLSMTIGRIPIALGYLHQQHLHTELHE
jgi:hypothetical protein